MQKKRREFLKQVSLAGFTAAAGSSILAGCNKSEGNGKQTEDWNTNPEWKEVKYGSWKGPGVPDGPGPMDSVLL